MRGILLGLSLLLLSGCSPPPAVVYTVEFTDGSPPIKVAGNHVSGEFGCVRISQVYQGSWKLATTMFEGCSIKRVRVEALPE